MTSPKTAFSLVSRLALLNGAIPEDHMKILYKKWGVEDGSYHSSKSIIKTMKLDITREDVNKIESDAVIKIGEVVSSIFICRHCGIDLRKSGFTKWTPLSKRSDVYIDSEGLKSREDHEIVSQQDDKKRPTYNCKECGRQVSEKDPVNYFIEKGFNSYSIMKYIEAIHDNIVVPDIDSTKFKVNEELYRFIPSDERLLEDDEVPEYDDD